MKACRAPSLLSWSWSWCSCRRRQSYNRLYVDCAALHLRGYFYVWTCHFMEASSLMCASRKNKQLHVGDTKRGFSCAAASDDCFYSSHVSVKSILLDEANSGQLSSSRLHKNIFSQLTLATSTVFIQSTVSEESSPNENCWLFCGLSSMNIFRDFAAELFQM